LNATGGLDGLADDFGIFKPVIADARGNILASYEPASGEVVWNAARPTGYGAVPEYRPVALADNGDVAAACAWRGRWPDISGFYWLGERIYGPVSGSFLSWDRFYDERNPGGYSFAGGDPINYFDGDGRLAKSTGPGSILGLLEHERFVNQYLTPKLTFEEAIWGLYGAADFGLNLPYTMAEGIANDLDTAIYGRSFNQYGLMQQASTGRRIWSGTMAVLPFVPVGTIADAGVQGIRGLRTGLRVSEGGLSAKRSVGWVNAIPKYDVNAPWYKYVTPSFTVNAGVVTQGRTVAQIAATKVHEGQHIMDVLNHPQITHLATKNSYFPGSGLARYWLEYRGYSAGGRQGLLTPLGSFSPAQQRYLAYDMAIFGGGSVGAGFMQYESWKGGE
jgi:RHS repeat-associated protein